MRWTLSGFLEHFRFVHKNMRDHAYAWVLGAGASKPSGILLGGELVQRWLGELHRRHSADGRPLAEWATEANLGIPGFKYEDAGSHYSRVYERRFADNPDEGFACLEALMSGKDPSPGYSILAQALEKTPNKVVISTNFDNLVADALSIYTATFPLVIGHESLANFVKVISRRPVICKIHRDLLLAPKNDHRSLRRLHESWAAALRALFSHYTPLFIGYGGNDDSLMDLLESLDPEDIKGQLVWCYYERAEPSKRIVDLVRQHRGALVPVPDFDLLMVLLGAEMGLEPIDHAIEERARKRANRYREQLIALDTTAYPAVRSVLRGAFERAGGTLVWQEKASNEPSTDRREQLYQQAIEQYPDDLNLQSGQAMFHVLHCRDLVKARALLTRLQLSDAALEFGPSLVLSRMAVDAGRLDEAEEIQRAVPESAHKQISLACVREAENNLVESERLIRLAIEQDTYWRDWLSRFLERSNRMDELEQFLRTWHSVEPTSSEPSFELARFLWLVRDDVEGATQLFREVLASTDYFELICTACFFLASGDSERFSSTLRMTESKPALTWHAESIAIFVRLVHAILAVGNAQPFIELIHRQLACEYNKAKVSLNILEKLTVVVTPRLPSNHRKFLASLAQAVYDPARRSALGNYPQWRAVGSGPPPVSGNRSPT